MKLENILENKAKFFAQYWRQDVLCRVIFGKNKNEIIMHNTPCSNLKLGEIIDSYLELKPLSQISDEDLIQLTYIPEGWKIFKIYHTTRDGYSAVKIRKLYDDNDLKFNADGYKYDMKTLSVKMANTVDYLRSKGYALPWMDLSVEDLVKYGWIKLKEN